MSEDDRGALVERGMREIKSARAREPFRESPSWKDYENGFRALLRFLLIGPSPESELVEEPEAEEPEEDNVLQFPAPDLAPASEQPPLPADLGPPPPEAQATPPADPAPDSTGPLQVDPEAPPPDDTQPAA